jgi:hypothetical protein
VSKAYSFQGTLNYPPDTGQANAARAFSQSGNFDAKKEAELVLTGAGTHTVSFGTVAKAKAILVKVRADSAAPVNLRWSGGAEDMEVSPGGFVAISSPNPSAGITGLDIVHTDDARVDVYILE